MFLLPEASIQSCSLTLSWRRSLSYRNQSIENRLFQGTLPNDCFSIAFFRLNCYILKSNFSFALIDVGSSSLYSSMILSISTSHLVITNWIRQCISLRKKCPYSEFFWSIFSRIRTKYGEKRGKCWKIRTRKTPNTDTFHAVFDWKKRPSFWKYFFRNLNEKTCNSLESLHFRGVTKTSTNI